MSTQGRSTRQIIEESFLRLVRLYTFNTPVQKGKYRIYQSALSVCRYRPDSLRVDLKDGRRFFANLTTGMQETVYFVGEFEKVLSEIALKLIRPGDICVDVGANFGWYASLMLLARAGEVHAFEPTPQSFRELQRNYELMGSPANVTLNNIALGDRQGTVQIHVFEGLGTGHASLASRGDTAYDLFDCKMMTLDGYLSDRSTGEVNFVKVDIEGAELMFLKGANRLFDQDIPPVIMMEMAAAQTANFGYHPNELVEYIRSRRSYDVYAVNEYNGTASIIEGFSSDDIGSNVFCIPRDADEGLRQVMKEYLVK